MNCCDAQSNETPRAKAAEVAAGKRMLELEKESLRQGGIMCYWIPDQVGNDEGKKGGDNDIKKQAEEAACFGSNDFYLILAKGSGVRNISTRSQTAETPTRI